MQPLLPEWVNGKRALSTLKTALSERGLTAQVQALFKDTDDTTPVTLPGFSMFDTASGLSATQWCVPRPIGDRDDIIGLWEEYIDRPLGRVAVPDRVARRILSAPLGEKFFGTYRREATEWWLPAAQLIAIASGVSGLAARVTNDSVTLDMGDYAMSVTPSGGWSNATRAIRPCAELPDDANIAPLRVPALLTAHPLAKALVSLSVPPALLWAANSLICCESMGRHPRVRPVMLTPIGSKLVSAKRNAVRRPGRERLESRSRRDIPASMATCRQILDDPYPGSHRDLYIAAVPALMSVRDFSWLVGIPGNNAERALTEFACENFADHLETLERELACRP